MTSSLSLQFFLSSSLYYFVFDCKGLILIQTPSAALRRTKTLSIFSGLLVLGATSNLYLCSSTHSVIFIKKMPNIFPGHILGPKPKPKCVPIGLQLSFSNLDGSNFSGSDQYCGSMWRPSVGMNTLMPGSTQQLSPSSPTSWVLSLHTLIENITVGSSLKLS